jgi:hypothetical protein
MATLKGKFKPNNPFKYSGDPTNIIYRSSWELKVMMFLDSHPNVLKWGSEEIAIPYESPIDGRIHRYFPDFFVEQINKDGRKEKLLIEVKPKHQTVAPNLGNKLTPKGMISKKYLNEVMTYGVNQAKWKAAIELCKDRGWKFQIITEDHLGIK